VGHDWLRHYGASNDGHPAYHGRKQPTVPSYCTSGAVARTRDVCTFVFHWALNPPIYGAKRYLWGCGVFFISAVINMLEVSYLYFLISMLLLVVGCNFTFIGATQLLAFTYKKDEQGKVQGLNEFMVFTAAAVGSLFAGQGIAWFGWTALNVFAIAWVAIAAFVIYRLEDPVGQQA